MNSNFNIKVQPVNQLIQARQHSIDQCFLTFYGFVHSCEFNPLRMHVPVDSNNLTTVYTMLLLGLLFVQDLLKLSNSFKYKRIRINCQKMGNNESNKYSDPMYFNKRRHKT